MRVSVIDQNKTPLMPCKPAKARKLIKSGKAIGRYNKLGVFYIQLTHTIESPNNQRIAIGIDPGSKWEGYSVNGMKETVINIMSEAANGLRIKKRLEIRSNQRRARRFKKWRRPLRSNRNQGRPKIAPSTRARWELKYRIVSQLAKIIPISDVVIEDIKAKTFKNGKRWNNQFSPVQAGKNHLYNLLKQDGFRFWTFEGWEVAEERNSMGLRKVSNKSKKSFESHCVDGFVLSALITGIEKPTARGLYYLKQIKLSRRQLHRFQFSKGGKRNRYGGTISLGLKRGTLVRHPNHDLCSVGGHQKGRISLHDYVTNKRLCLNAKAEDCKVLTSTIFRSILMGTDKYRKEN